MLEPKPVAVLQKNQEPLSLEATPVTASAPGHETHSQIPGSRCLGRLRGPTATKESCEPLSRIKEDKEELYSPTFLLSPGTSWCPGDCRATWVPTQISLILEMLPILHIPREWTSALILLQLPSLRLELSLEAQFL